MPFVDPVAMIIPSFFSGLLMFLAPCTLPIVPGYLAFIAGVPSDAVEVRGARKRIMLNAAAFVIGFSIVFILLGTFAGTLGGLIGPWRDVLARVCGAIIVIFGLTMLGVLHLPFISSTKSLRLPHFIILGRWESSLLIGILFALGWSPCIGPILGTILTIPLLSGSAGSAAQGAFLLGVFSLGLAIPFLLSAFFLNKANTALSHLTLVVKFLSIFGGVMLVLIGALMLTGNMALFVNWSLGFFDALYRPLLPYM